MSEAEQFPELYAESHVPYANAHVTWTSGVDPALVSRLHLVAVTAAGRVVVCRGAEGWRFLPGGTREPGESMEQLAERELMEEAGAALSGELLVIGAHVARSGNAAPYRPHHPHPVAHWAYAVAPVRVVGAPQNPPDGESVVDVLALPVTEAITWLAVDDPVHAAVVRLAQVRQLI